MSSVTNNEYYKIVLIMISQYIIYKYSLMYKQINGFICVRLENVIYANELWSLVKHYFYCPDIPGKPRRFY